MRDLKRTNAKVPAYKLLKGMKMEVFVPMNGTWSPVRECVSARKCRSYRTCSSCMRHKTTLTPSWKRPRLSSIAGYATLGGSRWSLPIRTWNVSSVPWMPLNPPGITCRKKLPQSCTGVRSALRADRSTDTREGCSRHGVPRSNVCLSNWKDFFPWGWRLIPSIYNLSDRTACDFHFHPFRSFFIWNGQFYSGSRMSIVKPIGFDNVFCEIFTYLIYYILI